MVSVIILMYASDFTLFCFIDYEVYANMPLARAFPPGKFPKYCGARMIIYGVCLDYPSYRDYLKVTLLHELGHVLGLRHELDERGFARTAQDEQKAG